MNDVEIFNTNGYEVINNVLYQNKTLGVLVVETDDDDPAFTASSQSYHVQDRDGTHLEWLEFQKDVSLDDALKHINNAVLLQNISNCAAAEKSVLDYWDGELRLSLEDRFDLYISDSLEIHFLGNVVGDIEPKNDNQVYWRLNMNTKFVSGVYDQTNFTDLDALLVAIYDALFENERILDEY